jgi:7,8-dihydropterin-6-yl-methyl-4-(beta-D-ribofuranosyl)aminobenzene 5'-phosphate synthase
MIQVRCLVENTAKTSTAFWGEHGVAWHIQTQEGQILFDTGQSGDVLLHNAALLGLDLAQINALVISHAHFDHTGGLPTVLEHTRPGIPLYAHPDLFRERSAKRGDQAESIGLRITRADLESHVDLRLSADPVEILPGVWTTGEITVRAWFEGRGPNHSICAFEGWRPDPYRDDFSQVLETNVGLVACSAAGTPGCSTSWRRFERGSRAISSPSRAAHTSPVQPATCFNKLSIHSNPPMTRRESIPATVAATEAMVALASAFGDRVQPCPVGTELTFE